MKKINDTKEYEAFFKSVNGNVIPIVQEKIITIIPYHSPVSFVESDEFHKV